MSPEQKEPEYKYWSLRIRVDLDEMVRIEAKHRKRKAPEQMEAILLKHYGIVDLDKTETEDIKKVIAAGKAAKAAKRPRKGSKKTNNG